MSRFGLCILSCLPGVIVTSYFPSSGLSFLFCKMRVERLMSFHV